LESHTQGSDTNPFTWVGKQGSYLDPEIDLYFLRARYYDPQSARFLSTDPASFEAGDSAANLYRYVGNDPVNNTDPSGRIILAAGSEWSKKGGGLVVVARQLNAWNLHYSFGSLSSGRSYISLPFPELYRIGGQTHRQISYAMRAQNVFEPVTCRWSAPPPDGLLGGSAAVGFTPARHLIRPASAADRPTP
jgi:RHS repeat-associated protein